MLSPKKLSALWTFNVTNKIEQIHCFIPECTLNQLYNHNVDYNVCKLCSNTVEED